MTSRRLAMSAGYLGMPLQIPRRLLQTGKAGTLPLKNRAAICNLKLLHPNFEYLFFDDAAVDRFMMAEFPQHCELFRSFRYPIQRYDFFRYLAVYRYGGFYFDLDVFLASDLEPILGLGCVFPFEGLTFSRYLRDDLGMDWQIGNYAFGAAAGHPFLKAVIGNCVKAQTDPAWFEPMMRSTPRFSRSEFYVLNTTGPGLISRTLAENPSLAGLVTVLFPDDVCDLRTWNRFGDIGIHLMDGSWRGAGGVIRSRLAQRYEDWMMKRLIRESGRFGKTRGAPITVRS